MRSQAMLSRVSAVVAQRLAYKDMNNLPYYFFSLALYAIIIGLSLILPSNIGFVIDGLGAYSVSNMAFFVPAIFYKKALAKFGLKSSDAPEVKTDLLIGKIFLGLGVFNSIMSIGAAIIEVKEG